MTFLHFEGVARAKAREAVQSLRSAKCLDPLGRSFARVYSPQGGAACAKATDLLALLRRRWSKKPSSRKSMTESRRGSIAKVETPRCCSAVDKGAPAPAQISKPKKMEACEQAEQKASLKCQKPSLEKAATQ